MKKSHSLADDHLLSIIKKLKPRQLICGESHHPNRLPHKAAVPDNMKEYGGEHSIFVEMAYCRQGTCAITLNDASFKLNAGDLCLIGRNVRHYESYLRPGASYVLTWFLFSHIPFISMHQSVYGKDGSFKVMNSQRVKSNLRLYQKIDQAAFMAREHKTEKWAELKKELVEIFGFYQGQKLLPHHEGTDKWHKLILKQIDQYIMDHLKEKITLQNVADKFSFSRAYIDTLFKKEYHYGLIELVIYRKIANAAVLLVTSGLRISEVARRFGYDDPYYFSRQFTKIFGMSPRRYRSNFS
jgi:AraC-like DNA-binding protein